MSSGTRGKKGAEGRGGMNVNNFVNIYVCFNLMKPAAKTVVKTKTAVKLNSYFVKNRSNLIRSKWNSGWNKTTRKQADKK